ncbi:DUF2069 domain-containing protein [Dyella flagellata]|uniref:DUF2069 domain-containing protein n=1 Tax=Dyella flagellata TaxID=1867833 RepID=A0ABQ5XE69_9GAMM|nr:DUF2069 domain-containing protein [Dyella flagellata]GLQ88830.1 hypothetical protein GCM10007898_24010 [Dyella flagellata]
MSLTYRIGITAWVALILLQCAWYAWLFPPQHLPMWLVLSVTVIPLLLPFLAIGNVRRALLWAGMLSLFYFCHGVAESWSSAQERVPALLEVLLALALIAALGAGVRRRRRA